MLEYFLFPSSKKWKKENVLAKKANTSARSEKNEEQEEENLMYVSKSIQNVKVARRKHQQNAKNICMCETREQIYNEK